MKLRARKTLTLGYQLGNQHLIQERVYHSGAGCFHQWQRVFCEHLAEGSHNRCGGLKTAGPDRDPLFDVMKVSIQRINPSLPLKWAGSRSSKHARLPCLIQSQTPKACFSISQLKHKAGSWLLSATQHEG